MQEIICGESQDGVIRHLSFQLNNSKIKDYHTFFLENGKQITVASKITNDDQQNVFRMEGCCQQFVSKM